MNFIACILLLIASLVSQSVHSQQGQSEQDLFEQAFGNIVQDQTAQYMIIIDKQVKFETTILITDENYYFQDIKTLKSQLTKVYKENIISIIDDKNKINKQDLIKYGINIEFDHSNLLINITPNPSQRNVSSESLYKDKSFEVNTDSSWSLYTNHFYNYNTRTNKLNYYGDFATNYKYFTVDGNHGQSSDGKIDIERVSLTRDWNKKMLRLQVGDISFSRSSLLGGFKGGGIKLSKENSLRPGIKIRRVNEQTFFLKKAAWVQIAINGQVFQNKYYQAGEHSLENFNLPRGLSVITLDISYVDGEIEKKEIEQFFSHSLLKESFLDYDLSFFNRSLSIGKEYYNDSSDLLLSSLSYGYNQDITINNEIAISNQYYFLGIGTDLTSSIGNFSFNAANSIKKENNITGWSAQVNWFYLNHSNQNSKFKGVSLGLDYKSKDFVSQMTSTPVKLSQLGLDISTQYRFKNNLSLDLNYSQDWSGKGKLINKVQARLSKQWRNGLRFVASLANTNDMNNKETSLLFQVQFSPASKNFSLNSQIDNKLNISSNLNYESQSRLPGYNLDINHSKSGNQNDISVSGNYDNQYFTGSSGLAWDNYTKEVSSNTNLGHSISFVDGTVAFSRPINGSFTIFQLEDFEKDRKIKMNADNHDGYDALVTNTPIAIGNETPYAGNYFELDSYDIKIGEEINNQSSFVVPRYKSGNIIRIKRKTNFYVRAKLSYLEKNLSNTVIDIIDSKGEVISQSFSDEYGEVFFEGLSNGEYTLDFGDYAPLKTINIKGEGDEVLDLGHININ